MKAIKDKVAVGDDRPDLSNHNQGSSAHAPASSEKGKGKGKRLFDDSEMPWERLEFRGNDGVSNGDGDVEHTETLHRPTRKIPHHTRRYDAPEDTPIATSSTQHMRTSSMAIQSETAPLKSLESFEFSFSTPRNFPPPQVSTNEASTSFCPEEPLNSGTVSLETPSVPLLQPASLMGSAQEPMLTSEGDKQGDGQDEGGFVCVPSSPAVSPTEPAEIEVSSELPTPDVPLQTEPVERVVPTLEIALKSPQAPTIIPVVNPTLSVFSTLVPPTPPPSTPAKLPFSIRDLKVAPLDKFPNPMASKGRLSDQSSQPSRFLNDGSGETDISLPGFAPSRTAAPSSRERLAEKGTMKMQRNRGRAGPSRVPKNTEEPVHIAAYFSQPLPAPTPQLPPPNWVRGVMPPLPLEVARMNEPLMPFISRPFVFPQPPVSRPSTATHSGVQFPPPSQGTQKPDLIKAPAFNINAKPFQPGTKSAPITPTDHSGFGMAHRGMPVPPPPVTAGPFGSAPVPHSPGAGPFAYAPLEPGRAGFFPFEQAGPSHSSPFVPQPYAVSHSAPGPLLIPARPTFNTGGRPTHGHHMSMGMSMGMGPGRPVHNPPALPPPARGRALTTGTDGVSLQGSSSQSINGSTQQSTHSQAHQRSSSLSTHARHSSVLRIDENNLLRPSSSSSGDSSIPSSARPSGAKISPMPWYGLPDPRPDIDRKQLEELEKKEERRKQREAAKSQKQMNPAEINRPKQQPDRTAPLELIIIESGTKKRDRNPAANQQPEPSPSLKLPNLL